jgi:zinc-binding alcohol dehydrogenase family protein
MKAIALADYLPITDPASLQDVELPQPVALGHDLLVRVEAISVNPVDAKVRSEGGPADTVPRVLGWDAAGIVLAVGPDVTLFKAGDPVYYAGSITRPGANSEFHLVDERIAGVKPASLTFAQAAALPLTSITAWESLFDRLGISRSGADAGKRLLIIGGAGGVGSIAIQLAKTLAGVTVIATASRAESIEWCLRLGADHVVDHAGDIPAQLEALGIADVDFILSLNDTNQHFDAMAEAIAPQGRICAIVGLTGPVPMEKLFAKSVTFAWELMFTRSMFGTADMIEQHNLLNQVSALVDAGSLKTTLGEVYGAINAANLRRAHAALESGRTIGKIVLAGFEAS